MAHLLPSPAGLGGRQRAWPGRVPAGGGRRQRRRRDPKWPRASRAPAHRTVSVSTIIAGQLRKPTGPVGRHVVSRILNRATAAMNELTLRLLELRTADVGALPYAAATFTKACTVDTSWVGTSL